MSTKPPTAVMIPSVSSSGFKAVLDVLQLVRMRAKLLGRSVIRQPQQRLDFSAVRRLRLAEARCRGLNLLADPFVHARDVSRRQLSAVCLLVGQRPLSRRRPRLLDILQVLLRTFRATTQEQGDQNQPPHAAENRLRREPFRSEFLRGEATALVGKRPEGDREAKARARRDAVLPIVACLAGKQVGGPRLDLEVRAPESG